MLDDKAPASPLKAKWNRPWRAPKPFDISLCPVVVNLPASVASRPSPDVMSLRPPSSDTTSSPLLIPVPHSVSYTRLKHDRTFEAFERVSANRTPPLFHPRPRRVGLVRNFLYTLWEDSLGFYCQLLQAAIPINTMSLHQSRVAHDKIFLAARIVSSDITPATQSKDSVSAYNTAQYASNSEDGL